MSWVKSGAKGQCNRVTPGTPFLALGFHGAISDGRAQAESSNCPVDMAAFHVDGARGLTGFPHVHPIPAKPLPPSVHPLEAAGWRIRHVKCVARLGATSGPPDICLRKIQEKLSLRFCLGWCLTSYHARTLPPDSLHLSAQQCLGGIIQAAIIREARLRAQVSIKTGGFGIRDLVLHASAAFLASSTSTGSPARQHVGLPQHHTRSRRGCRQRPGPAHRNDAEWHTPDPHVHAAGAQFRLTIHDDAAWRLDGTTRTCPACGTHTLWKL